MTLHMSVRMAWNDNGWEGRICKNPVANTFCIGQNSYPGDMIRKERNLDIEKENAGVNCKNLPNGYIPPCIYGINAFNQDTQRAYSNPPIFFGEEAERVEWTLPGSTVCTWPYEVMYGEEVRVGARSYDYEKRLRLAEKYFSQFESRKSLVFYYANLSNPFSEDEQKKYVIVGLSRLKAIGDLQYYRNTTEEIKQRYGGAYAWNRNVTSYYPEQGLRIPYHLYMEKEEVLHQILLTPENPRNFKYGSREITDDDALNLIDRFLKVANYLKGINDKSENWEARIIWLQSLISELWDNRGLYPGLSKVLEIMGFSEAIEYFKVNCEKGEEIESKDSIFDFVNDKTDLINGLEITSKQTESIRRQWKLRPDIEKNLLENIFPRFDLEKDQIEKILHEKKENKCGIRCELKDIVDNPYLICEQYASEDVDDQIRFRKIDNGVFPSPETGGAFLFQKDNWRRFRALIVDVLKYEQRHVFLPAKYLLEKVNFYLETFPDWKKDHFNEGFLKVDEEFLSNALEEKIENEISYIYLRSVFEDERYIEAFIKQLISRRDIKIKRPFVEQNWHDLLFDSRSVLATKGGELYLDAINGQIQVCQDIFLKPFSIICGEAGTGKTTIIKAAISAIEKVHGQGTIIQILAPTGKAVDRIRDITSNRNPSTVHSFLASNNWLNDCFTYRRVGGKRIEDVSTIIIDEASMVDLELLATLLRAININSLQRLIFIGDPNQLPPIGKGKVFYDIINWLRENYPENLAELKINIRQMENRINESGSGIIDLASIYIHRNVKIKNYQWDIEVESILEKIQHADSETGFVDKDLNVFFWNNPEILTEQIINRVTTDLINDLGGEANSEKPYEIWNKAFRTSGADWSVNAGFHQIISPYRGELFGTEIINITLQAFLRKEILERMGTLGEITLFDKVIQIRNRGKSNPLWGYNYKEKQNTQVEVFNGEIGLVKPHGFDGQKWMSNYFNLEHFQVNFSRKPGISVNYGYELGKKPNGKYIRSERVEDNLELAYAISVHKSQGSEFERVYFVVPKNKTSLLSRELFYTGVTRAKRHLTLFIEEDIEPLIYMRRPEISHLLYVNASLFGFNSLPEELFTIRDWYKQGKIHRTLADQMVRSKSEVIIANFLFDRDIPFEYEMPLYAGDGTFHLPDFTLTIQGEKYYWEHLGMMNKPSYRQHWEKKEEWYRKHGFSENLITTEESEGFDSKIIKQRLDAIL